MSEDKRTLILKTVGELMADFLFYDREKDSELSLDEIERCIYKKIITIDEIISAIKELIKSSVDMYRIDTEEKNYNKAKRRRVKEECEICARREERIKKAIRLHRSIG